MTKYKHMHTAFIKALNKLLTENLFKVQDVQELNDPEKVSSTWDKHLYGLADKLNDTEMQMIRMSPKNEIELKEVLLVESYPLENTLPEDGCIGTYYNPAKNTTTSAREPRIEYGLRKLTD